MKTVRILSLAAVTAMLIGCGGGSANGTSSAADDASHNDTNKITGYFIDAPVEGLFYSCVGTNSRGFTDSSGAFYCESSPVAFYIGKLSLGSVDIPTSDGNVYPQDLVGVARTDFSDDKLVELVQLLQSLDDDSVPDNGIKITKEFSDAFTTGMQFKTKSLGELLSIAGVGAIDATSAIEHLKSTMQASVDTNTSSGGGTGGNGTIASHLIGKKVTLQKAGTGTVALLETLSLNADKTGTVEYHDAMSDLSWPITWKVDPRDSHNIIVMASSNEEEWQEIVFTTVKEGAEVKSKGYTETLYEKYSITEIK